MKRFLIPMFFLALVISINAQSEKRAGVVNKILGNEIIIQYDNPDKPITVGDKLYIKLENENVTLEVTFPMLTVAKCRIIKGSIKKIHSGMPFFKVDPLLKKIKEINTAEDSLFSIDGVTLGVTTVKQLAELGKRATTKDKHTGDYQLFYIINGNNYWYDKDTNLADAYCFSYFNTLPDKWKSIGMDFSKSYDEWLLFAKKMGWEVNVIKEPHIEKFMNADSFNAIVEMDYSVYRILLTFEYRKGTSSGSDHDTLAFINVSYNKYK